LNLEHSYKYRPLDAYLIDRERWQRDKPLLIERADLQAFLDPHPVLAELDAALYRQYLTTNAHILDGENPHIKFKKVRFTVSTPTLEESDAEALQHYFPERDFVPLMEVLATVNRHTGWMEEFQHWQQRHHHGRPANRVVYAGVIGIGCTIGIRKMARISHPSANWSWRMPSIGSSRWITSTPLAIACCSSWIDSNCRSSCSARRAAPTPRAMARSLKCASILSGVSKSGSLGAPVSAYGRRPYNMAIPKKPRKQNRRPREKAVSASICA